MKQRLLNGDMNAGRLAHLAVVFFLFIFEGVRGRKLVSFRQME
jgi:hypothetical protein